MTDTFHLRVYYEDTDFGGIVYYANYLKFIERARAEYVRARGVDQLALKRDEGIVFAVRHVEADYLASAHYDDELTVETTVEALTGVRIIFRQNVKRAGEVIFTALVTVVAIHENGHPARLPANIRLSLH